MDETVVKHTARVYFVKRPRQRFARLWWEAHWYDHLQSGWISHPVHTRHGSQRWPRLGPPSTLPLDYVRQKVAEAKANAETDVRERTERITLERSA